MSDSAKRLIGGIHAVRTAIRHGAGNVGALWFDRSRNDKRLGQLLSTRHQIFDRVGAKLGDPSLGRESGSAVAEIFALTDALDFG